MSTCLIPTEPVVCACQDQDDPDYWFQTRSAHECKYGGPGSTMNFWELSAYTDRLTLGVKMHSTAAFLSLPNEDGIIMAGRHPEDSMITLYVGTPCGYLSLLVKCLTLSR